jgi:2-polyprenyl-3-methyl-5-hydroxy-6-metoxy-1,4-benzoquinol methylase
MFPDLRYRSRQKELIDAPDIERKLLIRNMLELNFLNRRFGGHNITLQGIRHFVKMKDKQYHIVDLGCGSGDSLKYMARWARSKGYKVKLTGIDNSETAISFLQHHCREYPEITGILSDYMSFLQTSGEIDIIHCSLFCHHLDDTEISELIRMLKSKVKIGFIINDLRRTQAAWIAVKILTSVLNGSDLARYDGLVSVQRGFTENELRALLKSENVLNFSISRRWAFRFLVTAFPSV